MDCYSVLEVPPTASTSTIRTAYRRLALKWHPDKNPAARAEATQRMSEINLAWEILKDPETRKVIDEACATGSQWTPAGDSVTGPWTYRIDPDIPSMMEVDSGCVRGVGHDGISTLYVEFRSGGLYVYRGVSVATYRLLLNAKSKGRFVIFNIVNGPYRCKRIRA